MNSSSKGELKIKEILEKNNITFTQEFTFPDLKGKRGTLLRYDFAIHKGNKIICLLDYDGIQHFSYVPFFHKSPTKFKGMKERDRRKNRYCLVNNIPLLRIPYWDYDKLTFFSLFNTKEYVVKSLFHNDYLKEVK